jgi:hypothetical protein
MRKSRTDLRTLCRIQAGVGGVLTIFYFSLASFFAVHSKALEAAQKAPCTLATQNPAITKWYHLNCK